MVYCNEKLIEANIDELLELYLNDNMDRLMDFDQYLLIAYNNGCKISGSPTIENSEYKALMINGADNKFNNIID